MVWTDGTTAYTAGGEPLDSVVVDDFVILADPRSGAMGYVRPEADSISGSGDVSQAREMAVGEFGGVWAPDASGESGAYVAYLPPLSEEIRQQITVETIPGARVRDVTTCRPSQVLLLVAHIDGPPESVTGLTYPGSATQERFSS